ncbi:acyl-CoA dehydrogenase family protein [Aquibaculum sediminis]|uniref:acyl-CoA dehydrogenase family protein n=1 Tax=Aquibaculum sediminis TaxID=3231907 RepID=UPI0034536942
MDFALTEEQSMLVESVRAFCERELYPHEDQVEQSDEVPPELAQEIRDKALKAGFYAANMPEELGGGGLDAVELALFERELGRPNYALQSFVVRPSNILQGCEGDQRESYLLPAIRGERMDCLAMTEPGAGSDVRGMSTRAVRDGGDWIVNGQKHFISHADVADFCILFAVTGEEETPRGPRKRISSFLVDHDTAGLEVRPGPRPVSHRGYKNCELYFTDCRIPGSALLGEEGRGFELANTWLGASRLTVATMCVGRAQRVMDLAVDWAAQRKQFGQPIGRNQGVGFKLADMATDIRAAELLTLMAAWNHGQGRMTDQDAAMAKVFASEMLARVTDEAVQIYGGMGLMDSLPLERFWRDARIERIWDGTSEIQRHIIARSLLRPLGA